MEYNFFIFYQLKVLMWIFYYVNECFLKGGRVVWEKESIGTLPEGVRQIGDDLLINNASPDIAGNYVCSVYKPDDSMKIIQEIIVIQVSSSKLPGKLFF